MNYESNNEGFDLFKAQLNRRRLAEAEIGDDVTVVDNGQTYTGKVQSKTTDGKLKLSFGSRRPVRDTFNMNEIKPGMPAKPGTAPIVPPSRPVTTVLPALTPSR